MRKVALIGVVCCLIQTLWAQRQPAMYSKADQQKMNHWVDSVYNRLSPTERVGQLFMVIANPKSDARNLQLVNRYVNELKIGGVLFHKGSPQEQALVTNKMQDASRVPLLVSLDGEWGLSMRLSNTTRFPKNMMLGAIQNDSLIYAYGQEVARQCRELGIHINFAPDIDVNSNPENPVIGLRAFGEDPKLVTRKGLAYARGMEDAGVMSVAKHFPGHGDTSEDSHVTLPVVNKSISSIENIDLYPFRRYIDEGFGGVMTGHLVVPALEKSRTRPTSLSKAIVTDLLQNKMGFEGLCFTDALAMKGASAGKTENQAVQALLAGNDVLLGSAAPFTDQKALLAAIENKQIPAKLIEEKCKKVLAYKYVLGLNNYKPIVIKGLQERLNTPHANWLAGKLNAEGLTLVKNTEREVPIKGLANKKIAVLSLGDDTNNEFTQSVRNYTQADAFAIGRKFTPAQSEAVLKKLENYDVIICGVHTNRIKESVALKKLLVQKDFHIVFFVSPYALSDYKFSVDKARSVTVAYENTPLAKEYAGQLLFGGIPAKGKLPVSVEELFVADTGINTQKVRLSYQEAEEVGLDAAKLEQIDEIVQEGIKAGAYPGCQILVAKDGVVVYDKAFGYYDNTRKKKVTTQSVYDLASVSKAAGTLPAVMKLYDENKLKLQGTLADYLPEMKKTNKASVQVTDLLYHQSGITPAINFYTSAIDKSSYSGSLYASARNASHPVRIDAKTYGRTNFKYNPELVSSTKSASYPIEVAKGIYLNTSFRDTIMQKIADSRVKPRGGYAYSCINFILLQKIVERQTGKSLDRYVDDAIFAPLGAYTTMYNPCTKLDTSLIVPSSEDGFLRKQVLRGYVHDEAAAFQGGVSGNAGLFSSAGDLAKLLQLYLNDGTYGGETLLSKQTTHMFTHSKSKTCRRGLGFDKPDMNNKRSSPTGEKAPASVYGHTGFTGTCFWVDPDNDLIYIFLSNRLMPDRVNNKLSSMDIRTRIQDAIYDAMR